MQYMTKSSPSFPLPLVKYSSTAVCCAYFALIIVENYYQYLSTVQFTMELTLRKLLLEVFKVIILLALVNIKLTAIKRSEEAARSRAATYLGVISRYAIENEDALNTPKKVEKALPDNAAKISDSGLAILGRIFTLAGVEGLEGVKGMELSSESTVNEHMINLMQLACERVWPIKPSSSSASSPVKHLSGQFPLVLSYLGCNLDGIPHLPSLMSSSLASRLAFLRCQDVENLFKEINVCLQHLKRVEPPHLMESLRDEFAGVIPMYRYPGLLFHEYALSLYNSLWYYQYLCLVEHDLFGSQPREENLATALIPALSFLNALQSNASKPLPDGSCLCIKHGYHRSLFERVRWPALVTRMLRIPVAPMCCEKIFWHHLHKIIVEYLSGYLAKLDLDQRRNAAEITILRCVIASSAIQPDSMTAELGSLHV
ncbi:unnamed protein product [Periconia digitata]|uniref:Uncharacterized protein n=1 Tax=Periconia digitata TaxID=1303443 RepID=A0A9W4USM9_9PLEO|nr:unnamed protein product [Periconia digitata]